MYDYRQYEKTVIAWAKPLPLPTDLQHAGLGMISEVGEIADALKAHMIYGKPIDVLNIKEEVGDGLWFGALAARLLSLDIQEVMDGVGTAGAPRKDFLIGHCFAAARSAALISVEFDDFAVMNAPLRLDILVGDLRSYMRNLQAIGAAFGFTLADAAEANLAKLAVRYKGKAFDPANGLNRDKDAERAAMSGGAVQATDGLGKKSTLGLGKRS
jgi:NTP pyrophosphatase (non-canonical NTP hydrolase)